MKSKFKLLCTVVALTSLAACSKEDILAPNGFDEFQNEAVIVGHFEGPTCKKGYAINIVSDPRYNSMKYSLTLPADSDITPVSIFPIKVVLNWRPDSVCTDDNNIIIHKIRKIE